MDATWQPPPALIECIQRTHGNLVADGADPTPSAILDRIGGFDGYARETIRRSFRWMVKRGLLPEWRVPAKERTAQIAERMLIELTATLSDQVVAAHNALVAEDVYPSINRLLTLIPKRGCETIRVVRNRLLLEGQITLPNGLKQGVRTPNEAVERIEQRTQEQERMKEDRAARDLGPCEDLIRMTRRVEKSISGLWRTSQCQLNESTFQGA